MTDRDVREACQMFLFFDSFPLAVAWLALHMMLEGTGRTVVDVMLVPLSAVFLFAVWHGLLRSGDGERETASAPSRTASSAVALVPSGSESTARVQKEQGEAAEAIVIDALFGGLEAEP